MSFVTLIWSELAKSKTNVIKNALKMINDNDIRLSYSLIFLLFTFYICQCISTSLCKLCFSKYALIEQIGNWKYFNLS